MKDLVFESWHSWKVCFLSGCKKFAWGFVRIVTCIIFGIVSLIVAVWRVVVKAVGKYPNIALGMFLVVLCIVAFVMWAEHVVTKKVLTDQRDSITWQYQNFKESHGYE